MDLPALEDGLFVNLLILEYLYIQIAGAGYRSVDRESCSYELTLAVGSASPRLPVRPPGNTSACSLNYIVNSSS